MTAEQMRAYEWAKNQSYQSVAARYAKELCGVIAALHSENAEKDKEIERLSEKCGKVVDDATIWKHKYNAAAEALSRVEAERDALLDRAHEAQVERDCARAERDAAVALVDELHDMLRPGGAGQGHGYAATNGVAYMAYARINEWHGAQGEG